MSCREEKDQRKKAEGRRRKGIRGRRKRRGEEEKGGQLHHLEDDCWALFLSIIFLSHFPQRLF